jgi:hypothetical protein
MAILDLQKATSPLNRVESIFQRCVNCGQRINETIALSPETREHYFVFFGGLLRIGQLLANVHFLELETLRVSKERAVLTHARMERVFAGKKPGDISNRQMTAEEMQESELVSRLSVEMQSHIESILLFLDILGDQIAVMLSHCFPGSKDSVVRTLDHLQDRKTCARFFKVRKLIGLELVLDSAAKIDSSFRNQLVVHNTEPKYSLSPQGLDDPHLIVSVFGGVSTERDEKFLTNPSIGVVSSFERHCELLLAFYEVLERNLDRFRMVV